MYGSDSHAGKENNEDDDDCDRDDSAAGGGVLRLPVVPEQFAVGEEVEGSEEIAPATETRRHDLQTSKIDNRLALL